jgi:hypothetical protein
MTTDVRTLLHAAADTPTRDADITRALATAHARRRRARGLGAIAAVVVIALGVGAIALGGGGDDEANVAIGPHQTRSDIPDGWKELTADPGISIAIPPEWNSYDFGRADVAERRIAVGTSDPEEQFPFACADPRVDPATIPGGTWISMWEYPADSQSVVSPTDGSVRPVELRPSTFAGRSTAECDTGVFTDVAFRDAGRVFLARVVVRTSLSEARLELKAQLEALQSQIGALIPQVAGHPPNEASLSAQLRALQHEYSNLYDRYAQRGSDPAVELAAQVLDTLRIEPLGGSSTTTVPVTTMPVPPSVALPTITTLPAFVPSTDDEKAIADLVVRWLHYQDDDGIRATIVDADSLLDATHEGMRQYEKNLPDGYTGRIESLHLNDASHADFVFTLFLHGGPLYSHLTAHAVKVDGRWMITRDSQCSLLSLGSITCPPPS